jgi:hypothetical protein
MHMLDVRYERLCREKRATASSANTIVAGRFHLPWCITMVCVLSSLGQVAENYGITFSTGLPRRAVGTQGRANHLRDRRALLRLRLYEDLLRVLTQYERPFTHRGDIPGLHMPFRCF